MSIFKVVVVGDERVGKTQLLNRYVYNSFQPAYKETIGADFMSKSDVPPGSESLTQLWDTAGQERFEGLGIAFYRGADGFVLVFDLSNRSTFESLPKHHATCLDKSSIATYVVIGNKVDAEQRAVSKEEAEAWSASIGAPYFETSALNSTGVTEVFDGLVKGLYEASLSATPTPEKLEEEAEIDAIKTNLLQSYYGLWGKWTSFLKREVLSQRGEAFSTEEAALRERLAQISSEVKLGFKVGDFGESQSGVSVRYHTGADATLLAHSFDVEDTDFFGFGLTFKASEDCDEFHLGELSSRIKAIGPSVFSADHYNLQVKPAREPDGTKVLRVLLEVKDIQFAQALREALAPTQGAKFNADLEFSERPTKDAAPEGVIKARLNVHLACSRLVLSTLGNVLVAISPANETPDQRQFILHSALTLKKTVFEYEFDDLEELWLHLVKSRRGGEGEVPAEFKTIGWAVLADLVLRQFFLPSLTAAGETAKSLYKDVLTNLRGLHAAHIVVGREYVMELQGHNLDIFQLPTLSKTAE